MCFTSFTLQDYFGLALNTGDREKWVKLKYLDINVRVVDVERDNAGDVVKLILAHNEGVCPHAISWLPSEVVSLPGHY